MEPKDYAVEFLNNMLMAKHAPGQKEEKHMLPHGEFGLLAYLYFQHDGANVGELTDFLQVTSGRTASALNSLERKGLVKRLIDKSDNRRICVYLTDKGRQIVMDEYNNSIKHITNFFEKLDDKDSEDYLRIMKKVLEKE